MKHALLTLLVAVSLANASAQEDWKLLPLEYNNPGLTVDLGVGLWAWPLPMDYDGDGDMDLVVSGPDKPTNGLYFFENPTQDPSVTMPIFKPAVRLGPTGRNVQVSYIDGAPRVLDEGVEFPDFKNSGIDKSKGKKIYDRPRFLGGKLRARMWRYVDWEGDGDQDLIAGLGDWTDYEWDHAYDSQGRWQNGPLHGWVYLIKNNNGKYSDYPVRLEAGGGPIDVYGWPSPNFADFDGDGDLDLLCGEFMDGFTYFENTGTRSEPDYATGEKMIGSDGEPLKMHLQMITPTAFDWDQDGDFDLIVGDEDGRVALVENVGSKTGPNFAQPVYFSQEADTLKFGALATPYAHDWDSDGDEDLVCGNTAGNIAIFTNLDGKGTKWSAPELLDVTEAGVQKTFRILAGENGSIQGPAEAKWGYTTLSVADWDEDGRDDIIYNSIWPKLQLLRNTELGFTEEPLPFWTEESAPAFYWWQTLAGNLQTQWRTTPLATDFDRDGKLDLVILDQEGYLTCQSRKMEETRIFIDEDNQPIRLNTQTAGRSGRYKLDVVDWDGDGRDDILVNSENATWWRNCEDRDGKVVLKRVGNLAKRNVAGHTSSPTACDFDKNGKPDLVIGAENGRIYFIKHEDCIAYSGEEITARPANPKAEPRFAGFVSEDFVFEPGKGKTKEVHASTICETTRGLVLAWFGGTKERNPDVEIWSAYNDGAGWSNARKFADGVQHGDLRYPTWNPVLYQPPGDAPTMLFFKVGPHPKSWWGEMMVSYDRGRSFKDRRRLPEGIDGPVRSKPLLLQNGTLLCPSSTEIDDKWVVHFERTRGEGAKRTWKRIGPIESEKFQAIQPTLLQHSDGRVQALCRTREGEIASTFSDDDGNNWSPLESINLPNPNSGIEAQTLADGHHLLVYNPLGLRDGGKKWGKRSRLHLAISSDGLEWKDVAALEAEETGEFSYPAMIQSNDGLIHVTYTWNRENIKHVTIDPSELKVLTAE